MTLNEIAKKMCAKGKGILAADESTGTIAKRFKSINVENLEKNRLVFRQTLFNAGAMKNYIGGVILFDATIREKTSTGISVPELLEKNNETVLLTREPGGTTLGDQLRDILLDNKTGANKCFALVVGQCE